jgi:hypothetical protein
VQRKGLTTLSSLWRITIVPGLSYTSIDSIRRLAGKIWRNGMEIIIGSIAYLIVVGLFVAFGKFLKECDDEMLDSFTRH